MNRPIFPPLLILATLIAGCPKDSYGGGCKSADFLTHDVTLNTFERIPINEIALAQLVAAEGLANPSLERINDGQDTRVGSWSQTR